MLNTSFIFASLTAIAFVILTTTAQGSANTTTDIELRSAEL